MPEENGTALNNLGASRFGDVPIEITISVGAARPLIRDLVEMKTRFCRLTEHLKTRSNFMSATNLLRLDSWKK